MLAIYFQIKQASFYFSIIKERVSIEMADTKDNKADDELTDLTNGWEKSTEGDKQKLHLSDRQIEIE